MLYDKLGIDFFSTSEVLYPNMKNRLRLIRARPYFYMIGDNPNVSVGIVDCSLYTCRIALKDDYHKKGMDMPASAPVEYNYLETLAKTFIIRARQNHFIQENIFNNAAIRRVAIAMNTNSAFTGSFIENPFCYQQLDLRQIRILRGAANCGFWYRCQLSSIRDQHESNKLSGWCSLNPHWWFPRSLCACVWLDFNARRYWKLSLSWTCWRAAETGAKIYQSSQKRYWTNCIGWTNVVGCSWQVWCCWKECVNLDKFALEQIINRIPLLKFWYLGSFPSHYVPTLDNETFAVINTQPSNMQGEHWIMIANFQHELYFADSLGCKVYSFLNKQHYKHMMPAPLESHPSVCGFYTIYAAFHLFKFRQEELQDFTMLLYSLL